MRDDCCSPRDPAFPDPQSQIPNPGPPSIRPGTDAGAGSPVSSRLAFSQGSCVTASTLAFVFPGQGSQSLAMLAELSELHPQEREALVEESARCEHRRVGKEVVGKWRIWGGLEQK